MVTCMKSLVFSLLLSLAAPWGALCLADAPGHSMACCPANQTPMVRPCCAMDADRLAPMLPAAVQAIPPAQLAGVFAMPIESRLRHRDTLTARFSRPIEIRLLTSVILV